jgi:DnaK suppressor protein
MNSLNGRKPGAVASVKDRESRQRSGVLDLDEMERRLIDERRKLISALTSASLVQDELGEGWQERDSPSEDELREVEYTLRDAQHRRLNLVDEALERLRAGSFAICIRCGKNVSARRLETDPAISVCLDCAKKFDPPPPKYCF